MALEPNSVILKVITKEDIYGNKLPNDCLYFSSEYFFDSFKCGELFTKNCKCKLIPYKGEVSIDRLGLVWQYDIIIDNIGDDISPIYIIGKLFEWKKV